MNNFKPNSETALIFNIQKFCLHDGPGIRSTIFFSGCPLRCPWCSNPESQLLQPRLMYDVKRCTHCRTCEKVCPTSAIKVDEMGWWIDRDKCTLCSLCVDACLQGAIEIQGKEYTIDQVVQEVLKDKEFYEKSGGGVTFSGGEVLMQIDFAARLADRLHQHKIHIACETTGSAHPWEFQKLIESVDLFLLDIKHYDKTKLKEVCNGDYENIKQNTISVIKSGKPIIGRIPIIPRFNNTIKDMKGFAKYAKEIGISEIHLLPFHQYGEVKYEQLSMDYLVKEDKALQNKDIEEHANYLKKEGFKVQLGG